jgi:hypothetical protein
MIEKVIKHLVVKNVLKPNKVEPMLGGSFVTMAWRVLRLQMKKASRYGG